MAENKTQVNDASVEKFITAQKDEQVRKDCHTLIRLMSKITGEPPRMWGTSIIGFGKYRYVYASGREGDWMKTGFSPRKSNLSVYSMSYVENYPDLLQKLGKFSMGKGCLYFRSVSDINLDVLETLLRKSMEKLMGHFSQMAAAKEVKEKAKATKKAAPAKKAAKAKPAAKKAAAKKSAAKAAPKKAVKKSVKKSPARKKK